MERIGIYGGTFNPPHIGHLQAAEYALNALGLDRLLLMPAAQVPGKPAPQGSADKRQRWEMLRIALLAKDDPRLVLHGLELESPEPLFTYQTLRELRQQYPDAQWFLILGSDQLRKFPDWRNSGEIAQNATLAVLRRGEKGENTALQAQKDALEACGARVILLDNPVVAISSTQMRRLLAFRCAGEFLPEGVLDYIRENRMYDTRAAWKNLPMDQLEKVVISLLDPNRVAHVLGCRDTAVKLAQRWGADVTDAARAGILHDITKAIDGPLQLTLCQVYGKILSGFSRRYPKTLHALTGSLVAERIFGENKEVVSAIEHHTTGKADMTLLQKIIYVADYMEPNRNFPGVEKLRELAFANIDGALKLGLEMTLEHLNRQGAEVSPESREALAWLSKD